MKKSMYLALAGVLVNLVGCATAPSELRNGDASHKASFVVEQNYQATYRSLLERQRSCEQSNVITAQYVVQGDLFTDLKSATITTALHGALGIQTENVVDIKAVGEATAEVSVATRRDGEKYAATLRKWLSGVQECS